MSSAQLTWREVGREHWFADLPNGYSLHIEVFHHIGAPRGLFAASLCLGGMDSLEGAKELAEREAGKLIPQMEQAA